MFKKKLKNELLQYTVPSVKALNYPCQSMKAVQPVIASNGVPYLLMRSIGSHSTSGKEKEGIKERTVCSLFLKLNYLCILV